MNELKTETDNRTTPPRSPKAVLSTSREEFYGQDRDRQPIELIVKAGMTENIGQLPADLQGHVFIVGAVGCVASPRCEDAPDVVLPSKDGWTSLLNGEGAIYRFDFHQTPATPVQPESQVEPGKAWMAMRIVKTPDYYADTALTTDKYKDHPSYSDFLFRSFGITRLSLGLGIRNYLNRLSRHLRFGIQTLTRRSHSRSQSHRSVNSRRFRKIPGEDLLKTELSPTSLYGHLYRSQSETRNGSENRRGKTGSTETGNRAFFGGIRQSRRQNYLICRAYYRLRSLGVSAEKRRVGSRRSRHHSSVARLIGNVRLADGSQPFGMLDDRYSERTRFDEIGIFVES
ncbi:MAG TPA: hypothetical protein IGS17_06300 [Oscillatoriales cyanobacterium M59_W2019_021]|nr:hypothetical protein [Oscillatoriales cyanobacterium M4454_W2019_049]HIK50523.1 hypothetical protein [Oscillatoriales cyanobacterium M59_W2019_021]